jgi:predicted nuclease of predicted toxin-antitoxin system
VIQAPKVRRPFLADESCAFAVVKALREAGHDVTAIVEVNPGIDDGAVIAPVRSESRVLLTEDKDFGQLAHAGGHGSGGARGPGLIVK